MTLLFSTRHANSTWWETGVGGIFPRACCSKIQRLFCFVNVIISPFTALEAAVFPTHLENQEAN